MKERNTFDSPTVDHVGTLEKSDSNQMEIDDDEDFDLETPHTSHTRLKLIYIAVANYVPFFTYL